MAKLRMQGLKSMIWNLVNEPETGGASSSAAGIDSQDTMVGMLTSMNIVDISEVFSPPRVVMQGLKIGLQAGSSMHLLTGWDFNLESDRNRAMMQFDEEKPMLLIGSPPCTYFLALQELNKFNMRHDEQWLARFNDNLIRAIGHIQFCINLHIQQMGSGRYWLLKHPRSAKSWQIPEMEELLNDPRVQVAYANQCQFGLTAKIRAGSDKRRPAKKPTGFIGNSLAIA